MEKEAFQVPIAQKSRSKPKNKAKVKKGIYV